MPEEKPDVTGQIEETVERVSILKKAGLPWPAIILLAVMSSPGFYSWLFDNTDEVAQEKAIDAGNAAKVTYETLVVEIKSLQKANDRLNDRVQNLTNVTTILLQKGIGVEGPTEVDVIHEIVNTPVHTTAPDPRVSSSRRPRGSGSVEDAAPIAELVPPEVLEEMIEQNEEAPPPEARPELPDDLDGLVQSKK